MILSGKTVREELKKQLMVDLKNLETIPELVIIQIGDNPESEVYIRQKKLFGDSLGIPVHHIVFPKTANESEIVEKIKSCNADKKVSGIIVQLPIPKGFNVHKIVDSIDPRKDVDCLTEVERGKFYSGNETAFVPATARGILTLLDFYKIDISGKHVVVVGRSNLVGKPIALSCLRRNATVTICHSYTKGLRDITKTADILIVAVGKNGLIDASYVKEGQIIIDVGINKTTSGVSGDVNFQEVEKIVSGITPVPGGVGPMTVSSLFLNLLDARKN